MIGNGFRNSRNSASARARQTLLACAAYLLAFTAAAQALAQELDTIEPG